MTEEINSELEDTALETSKTEEQRVKRLEKKNRISKNCSLGTSKTEKQRVKKPEKME